MNAIPADRDVRDSLNAHVAERGSAIRVKYGPRIGLEELEEILKDRTVVRYPCELTYDDAPLLPGEFAHPVARSGRPEEGFTMYVHPYFREFTSALPFVVFYQLVMVNYGDFASTEDAETFGAAALGLSQEEYYLTLCNLADALAAKRAASDGTP